MRWNPKELIDILLAAGMTKDEAMVEAREEARKRRGQDIHEVKVMNTYLLDRTTSRPPHLGS